MVNLVYDIQYNIPDDYELEHCYLNVQELLQYPEQDGLSQDEMIKYVLSIPAEMRWQFLVVEWDDTHLDDYHCPDFIMSINADDWLSQNY